MNRSCLLFLAALSLSSVSAIPSSRRLLYDEFQDSAWPNRHPDQFKAADEASYGEWKIGRATFAYNHDGMSVDEGACHYGKINPKDNGGRGLQVAALSDTNPDYAGSCGKCYELRCANMVFSDNYNETIDRSNVCYDTTGSLVLKIVDSCPCNYPDNAQSNKRWCCGDMTHFDASYWAMLKFANPSNGVIGINYRSVPCDSVPKNDLGPIGYPPGYPQAKDYPISFDGRTNFPAPPPSVTASFNVSSPGSSSGSSASADVQTSDPKKMQPQSQPQPQPGKSISGQFISGDPQTDTGPLSLQGGNGGGSNAVYFGGMKSGWFDGSYGVGQSKAVGSSLCKNVQPGGAISFGGGGGRFQDMMSLGFKIKNAEGTIPNIGVSIGKDDRMCDQVDLSSLQSTRSPDVWTKFDVYLGNFGSASNAAMGMVEAFAAAFEGCGGMDSSDINKIVFKSTSMRDDQDLCLDDVNLEG